MSRLWTVLAHPWHECYLDALPYLVDEGDTVRDVKPHMWEPATGRIEIVLGLAQSWKICPNVRRRAALAQNVIPYETENLIAPGGHRRDSEACRKALGLRPWLNYSRVNARVFGDIPHAPRLWFDIEATKRARTCEKEYDVFFAGSINGRRAKILSELQSAGLTLGIRSTNGPAWGAELAADEAKARIVLNLHYYEPGVFEVFRVCPALSRGALVVSESDDYGEADEWCDGIRIAPYEKIVETCLQELGRKPIPES